MRRKGFTPVLVILLIVIISSVYYIYSSKNSVSPEIKETPIKPEIIGGQRDEHGCLGPAGYTWCELKQKCLRTWEEPCEDSSLYKDWLTYPSKKYGFEIKFPPTWQGYKVSEQDYEDHSVTGISFGTPHQPFSLIQIIRYTPEQWQKIPNKSQLKILSQEPDVIIVCDGCCGISDNYTGGGQFDEFQIARCKEGAEIVKSFKLTSGD